MLGRPFHGYEAGTERARALGLNALWGGRPDLLQPEAPVNAHIGVGQVSFSTGGALTVGAVSVRLVSTTAGRARLKLRNVSFQGDDGTISGYWREQFGSGAWYPTPANPNPNEQCRLAYAFGRPATVSDPILECGQSFEITALVPEGELWVLPLGSAGSTVRYVLEEITDHDAAREQQNARDRALRQRGAVQAGQEGQGRSRDARRLVAGRRGGRGAAFRTPGV